MATAEQWEAANKAFEARMDERFGTGKWHCDDLWAAKSLPECAHAYLDVARAPAHGFGKAPPLFATYDGKRVRVVMASRMGDVGITPDLTKSNGYERRVWLPELTDFSAEP